MQPQTRYARSGDYSIAYQAVGDGPIDLVLAPSFMSNVEGAWNNALQAHFYTRLASFSRLIRLDKRGAGLSDPVSITDLPTLEERMDDVRAVMDAVGSERAALLGISEGGPLSIMFAATYPERTRALILYGTHARFLVVLLAAGGGYLEPSYRKSNTRRALAFPVSTSSNASFTCSSLRGSVTTLVFPAA
jgi:pimeloyl-ACP methyl ester carboxylesterase